jgi:hypothetical protein
MKSLRHRQLLLLPNTIQVDEFLSPFEVSLLITNALPRLEGDLAVLNDHLLVTRGFFRVPPPHVGVGLPAIKHGFCVAGCRDSAVNA